MSKHNKEYYSREVADVLGLAYARRHGKAYDIVKAILTVLTEALRREDRIEIEGFGVFKVRTRKPRNSCCYYFPYLKQKGLHKEIKLIPARKYVWFQPSKVLLRLLNPKEEEC